MLDRWFIKLIPNGISQCVKQSGAATAGLRGCCDTALDWLERGCGFRREGKESRIFGRGFIARNSDMLYQRRQKGWGFYSNWNMARICSETASRNRVSSILV